MNTEQRNYFKRHWITLTNLALIIGFIFTAGTYKGDVDKHIQDEEIHPTYKQTALDFITRAEFESLKEEIKEDLNDIKNAVNQTNTDIKKILSEN